MNFLPTWPSWVAWMDQHWLIARLFFSCVELAVLAAVAASRSAFSSAYSAAGGIGVGFGIGQTAADTAGWQPAAPHPSSSAGHGDHCASGNTRHNRLKGGEDRGETAGLPAVIAMEATLPSCAVANAYPFAVDGPNSDSSLPPPFTVANQAGPGSGDSRSAEAGCDRTVLAMDIHRLGVVGGRGAHGNAVVAVRRQLARILTTARSPNNGVTELYSQVAATLKVRKPPQLLETDALESPALVGLWRPRILVPTWLVARGRIMARSHFRPIRAHLVTSP